MNQLDNQLFTLVTMVPTPAELQMKMETTGVVVLTSILWVCNKYY